MQSNTFTLDNPTTSLKTADLEQLTILTENLRYSLLRRLENLIALSQEALEYLQNTTLTPDSYKLDHQWVMLEDTLRLAQNDWALLEWLR